MNAVLHDRDDGHAVRLLRRCREAMGSDARSVTVPRPVPDRVGAGPGARTSLYLQWLTWSFAFFNSARVVAYLPTLWTIHASGDSGQHSLMTWLTFAGSNATMAAWLFENNGRRVNRAVAVSACNAAMCAAISVLIVTLRLGT